MFSRSLDIFAAVSPSLYRFPMFFLAWVWALEQQSAKAASLEWQLLLSAFCLKGSPSGIWDLLCVNQSIREGIPPHFAQVHTISVRSKSWSLLAVGWVPGGIHLSPCSAQSVLGVAPACPPGFSPFWEQLFSSMMTLQCRNLSFLKNLVWKGTNTLWN